MVFFKDFSKEVKDVFTKNTAEGKAPPSTLAADGKTQVPKAGQFNEVIWKVESKLKATKDRTVVINPVADAKGVTANAVWYCTAFEGAQGKMAIKPNACAKPTFTYENSGRKVEVTTDSFKGIQGYEVSYEDKQKTYNLIAKLTEKAASVEVSVPVAAKIETGASVTYGPKDGKTSWAAGVLYSCDATQLSAVTTKGESFSFGAYIPVPGAKLEGKPIVTAFQADFDRLTGAFDATAGVTARVPYCPCGSSFKFKINKSLAMSISHFVECAGWKIASTFDVKEKSVGVLFTME